MRNKLEMSENGFENKDNIDKHLNSNWEVGTKG